MGVLFGLLSALGFGSADFLALSSTRKLGTTVTLLWMLIVGCVASLLYFLFTFSSYDFSLVSKNVSLLLFIGLLQTIAYLALYRALEIGKAGIVTPIIGSWSSITVVLSVVFLNEILKTNQIFAILSILIGIILLSINIKDFMAGKGVELIIGIREAFIAMISFGVSFFLISPVTDDLGWFLPTFFYRLFALGWLAIFVFYNRKKLKLVPKRKYLLPLLPIGVLDMAAFFAYSIGVHGSQGSIVAPISTLAPLITIILAYIFFKERLNMLQLAGVALSLLGVVLMSI